jgi:hypothetical protein
MTKWEYGRNTKKERDRRCAATLRKVRDEMLQEIAARSQKPRPLPDDDEIFAQFRQKDKKP